MLCAFYNAFSLIDGVHQREWSRPFALMDVTIRADGRRHEYSKSVRICKNEEDDNNNGCRRGGQPKDNPGCPCYRASCQEFMPDKDSLTTYIHMI